MFQMIGKHFWHGDCCPTTGMPLGHLQLFVLFNQQESEMLTAGSQQKATHSISSKPR